MRELARWARSVAASLPVARLPPAQATASDSAVASDRRDQSPGRCVFTESPPLVAAGGR